MLAMTKSRNTTRPRKPSGDMRPPIAPIEIKRRRLAVAHMARNPWLDSALGRLAVLEEAITDAQAAAGITFANIVGQYGLIMGLPHRSARSPSYEMGFAGVKSWGNEDIDQERIDGIKERYQRALKALFMAGPRVQIVILRVCVDDQNPAWDERPILHIGLDKLVEHFGLTKQKGKG